MPNNPDPVVAWNVVITIGILLNLLLAVSSIIRAGQSQKREVTLADSFVSAAECELHRNTSNNSITRLESELNAIRTELKESVEAWREEGDDRTRRLHVRIDNLPAQIVALLKNTGAIK